MFKEWEGKSCASPGKLSRECSIPSPSQPGCSSSYWNRAWSLLHSTSSSSQTPSLSLGSCLQSSSLGHFLASSPSDTQHRVAGSPFVSFRAAQAAELLPSPASCSSQAGGGGRALLLVEINESFSQLGGVRTQLSLLCFVLCLLSWDSQSEPLCGLSPRQGWAREMRHPLNWRGRVRSSGFWLSVGLGELLHKLPQQRWIWSKQKTSPRFLQLPSVSGNVSWLDRSGRM